MVSTRHLPPTHQGGGLFALLLRFGSVALVAVIGAAKVNFHDRAWATAFLAALAIALAGVGIRSWQSWTISESAVYRYCGYALLALGIVALLVVSPHGIEASNKVDGVNAALSGITHLRRSTMKRKWGESELGSP